MKTPFFLHKKFLVGLFLLSALTCSAQRDSLTTDPYTVAFHWPYFGPRMPPFMGVVAGYEGFHNHCWEAGLAFHMLEVYNEKLPVGNMAGFMLTYKRSLTNPLQTVEAELGIYSPVCLGFGFSENFYAGTRTFGFRPFIGTAWYHFQVLAGYNFYSKRQTGFAELDHFTVKIRYVLPVVRIFRNITPNPGNNY